MQEVAHGLLRALRSVCRSSAVAFLPSAPPRPGETLLFTGGPVVMMSSRGDQGERKKGLKPVIIVFLAGSGSKTLWVVATARAAKAEAEGTRPRLDVGDVVQDDLANLADLHAGLFLVDPVPEEPGCRQCLEIGRVRPFVAGKLLDN